MVEVDGEYLIFADALRKQVGLVITRLLRKSRVKNWSVWNMNRCSIRTIFGVEENVFPPQ